MFLFYYVVNILYTEQPCSAEATSIDQSIIHKATLNFCKWGYVVWAQYKDDLLWRFRYARRGGDVVYLERYGRQACPAAEWPSLNKTCTCLRGRRGANYPRLIAACVRACVSGRGADTPRCLHRLPTLVFVNKKAAGIKEQMALGDWYSIICYRVEYVLGGVSTV